VTKAYLAHRIDSLFSKLFSKIFSLLQSDSVLASHRAIHGDRAFDHTVDQVSGELLLRIIIEQDCLTKLDNDRHSIFEVLTVKVAIPNVSTDSTDQATASYIIVCFLNDVG
jgi:hypothetical protein